MRNFFTKTLLLIALGIFVFLSIKLTMPWGQTTAQLEKSGFSTENAFTHVEKIGKIPHSIGTKQHSLVRNYIVNELQNLGIEVQTQKGYYLNENGVATAPENIIAKLPGTSATPGNDVLILSHYDSAVHSSPGASDAASGVATILETLRVFKEKNITHKNNLIICLTDAEEIGLNGAGLFVEEHPWVEDIGLVLNFEARGSGGPSNTILETNSGNAKLIEAFAEANPEYPLANSLMYSVYKKLPNDTDATVFREKKNIPSFFFAFIDDHFDYHTQNDTPENLDKNSLAHQATYLMATLPYFGNTNLAELTAEDEHVYFNLPVLKVIHYSFDWIYPLLIFAWILFFFLVVYGYRKKRITTGIWAKGFFGFMAGLILSGLATYFGWQIIQFSYPHYTENLHGFTKNGHYYIAGFVLLTLAILFLIYQKFRKAENVAALLIAPLFIWLLLNTFIAVSFKGAAYFCLPLYFALFSFWVMIRQAKPSLWAMLLFALPAIFIFAPLIQFFPVGLGLKMLVISAVFCVLLFGLCLPVLGFYRRKIWLGFACLAASVICFGFAHWHSNFSEENPKPNSLLYLLNVDEQTATWNTYDDSLDVWTKKFISEEKLLTQEKPIYHSKYNSGFTYQATAFVEAIPSADFTVEKDSLDFQKNSYRVKIAPQRNINRIELMVDKKYNFSNFEVNGKTTNPLDKEEERYFYNQRNSNHLLTYYAIDRDTLSLKFSVEGDEIPQLEMYEASNDLLKNPWIDVPARSNEMMPKPFVLNDAIITKQTINLEKNDANN